MRVHSVGKEADRYLVSIQTGARKILCTNGECVGQRRQAPDQHKHQYPSKPFSQLAILQEPNRP